MKWVRQESPHETLVEIHKKSKVFCHKSFYHILKNISKKLHSENFHVFSSDLSISRISKKLNLKYTVLDPDRLAHNIIGKDVLEDPLGNWFNMPPSVRFSLIKRVVLIGPESVGKSTIANILKQSCLQYPFLPEYGRPYEVFRDIGPYSEQEFDTIVTVHSAHRQALLPFSGPVFIEDTDELATSVWAEMLIGKKLAKIERRIKLPFLYLLMDASVPFVNEKTRYFDKNERLKFFKKIKTKLDFYRANYVIIKGTWNSREKECEKIIKDLLLKEINWLDISN